MTTVPPRPPVPIRRPGIVSSEERLRQAAKVEEAKAAQRAAAIPPTPPVAKPSAVSSEQEITRVGFKYVQRQFKDGRRIIEDTERREMIAVASFEVQPAAAVVEITEVHNLGNYESVHLKVGGVLPCYAEELSDARAFLLAECKATIREELGACVLDDKAATRK